MQGFVPNDALYWSKFKFIQHVYLGDMVDFPFLSSNIPSSPAYGVFISQLIRYTRACSSYAEGQATFQ